MLARALTCLLLAAASRAHAGAPDAVDADQTFVVSGRVSLTGPLERTVRSLEFTDRAVIQTNGYPLHLRVTGDLVVNGTAEIRAWPREPATSPPAAANGATGESFDFGPGNKSGAGRSGGEGAAGAAGVEGLAGRPAGTIWLQVFGDAKGTLAIEAGGERGRPGGAGGKGGTGGRGEQGTSWIKGEHHCFLGHCWDRCVQMAGEGGPGGNGGTGGPAGAGGRGGDGGLIAVSIRGDATRFSLTRLDVGPGPGGLPGTPGGGGAGGAPGCGGKTRACLFDCCESWPKCRVGERGVFGDAAPAAEFGFPGRSGASSVRVQSAPAPPPEVSCRQLAGNYAAYPDAEWETLSTFWAIAGRQLFGVEAQEAQTAGRPSYVFFASAAQAPLSYQIVRNMLANRLAGGCPSACPYNGPAFPELMRLTDGATRLQKWSYLLNVLGIGITELARNTRRVSMSQWQQGALEPGKFYYAWGEESSTDPSTRLFTALDDVLLGRLARALAVFTPGILQIYGSSNAEGDSLVCVDGTIARLPIHSPLLGSAGAYAVVSMIADEPQHLPPADLLVAHGSDASALVGYIPDPGSGLPWQATTSFESLCEFVRSAPRAPERCAAPGLGDDADAIGAGIALPRVFATVALLRYIQQSWEASELSTRLSQQGPPDGDLSPCERMFNVCPDLRD